MLLLSVRKEDGVLLYLGPTRRVWMAAGRLCKRQGGHVAGYGSELVAMEPDTDILLQQYLCPQLRRSSLNREHAHLRCSALAGEDVELDCQQDSLGSIAVKSST
ncbi:uncharacterized protein ARMOST_12373 [Armillaria ostoyae]|uniref:Uncharacterized protein n=1 Tax=Armillaria ostoyae TaxID=47428 RepID=A0A284RJV4_ARMOS|nr:uncharacterized protein ARMOST_12373 [Armillaria ostoyae]